MKECVLRMDREEQVLSSKPSPVGSSAPLSTLFEMSLIDASEVEKILLALWALSPEQE